MEKEREVRREKDGEKIVGKEEGTASGFVHRGEALILL